ncbi:hypothetical protein SMICM17S_05449 [Streptomyces microflavus]
MIATEVGLGVKPANEYLFLVIASPAGAYFPGGVKPVSIWLSENRVRAVPGGVGDAKTGGNYAASLLAQAEAAAHGCAQVAYLDAVELKWVEELGGMNLYFVYEQEDGSKKLITPALAASSQASPATPSSRSPATSVTAPRRAASPSTSGATTPRRAPSRRSSPAAPPPSSPPSAP